MTATTNITNTTITPTYGTPFSHISVKPLHPTFAAEVSGVDFTTPLSDNVFKVIHQAVTKVFLSPLSILKRLYPAIELAEWL